MKAEPIETTVDRLARFGYDSIEISGEPYIYDAARVRRLLDDAGIACWGSVALMMGDRNLLASDADQRARSVQYVKDCISLVRKLDGQIMCLVPSTVGVLLPSADVAEEWEWAVDSLRNICDHAREEGIRVGVEPLNRFETYFINRCDQALALARDVGSDCGVVLDTFHMNIEEVDLIGAIHQAGDRLVDFHVADSNRLACGQGHLDWPGIIAALRDIEYDGALSVEFVPPVDRTPVFQGPVIDDKDIDRISPEHMDFIRSHGGGVVDEAAYDDLVRRCVTVLRPLMRTPVANHG